MDNEIKEEIKKENKVLKFLKSKLFKNLLIFSLNRISFSPNIV